MGDVLPFGGTVLLVAVAVLLGVLSNRISEWVRVPAPAIFLLGAAVASDLFPALYRVPLATNQRIVTVALIFVLFNGGLHIGRARFRTVAGAVLWVGVLGTLLTAVAMALAAHYLFAFGWRTALLLGTALAPTDPAVVFAVLGRREIAGRSGTLLEGESGANDPVGIALMVALLGATGSTGGATAVLQGSANFVLQMAVGGAVGVAGGAATLILMRRLPLPNDALYPIRTLACVAGLYGMATVAHGSGFLAVFAAGIILGDERAPYKREIERFAEGLASLAEIVAFTVLGLSVSVRDILHVDQLVVGLSLGALLIFVVRPVLVGLLLTRVDLDRGEKIFVLWAGLKGAVPILLATFLLTANLSESHRVYGIVFLVVLMSVVVQGSSIPAVARRLKVPMRAIQLEPWALGMRFQDEPHGLHRHTVMAGSPADGCTIAKLTLGEETWISLVSREGQLVQVRDNTVLRARDEVLALGAPEISLDAIFGSPPQE